MQFKAIESQDTRNAPKSEEQVGLAEVGTVPEDHGQDKQAPVRRPKRELLFKGE